MRGWRCIRKSLNAKTLSLNCARPGGKKAYSSPQLSPVEYYFVNDKAMVELYYNEALSVMEFLMDKFGKDNFVKLCHALKERAL